MIFKALPSLWYYDAKACYKFTSFCNNVLFLLFFIEFTGSVGALAVWADIKEEDLPSSKQIILVKYLTLVINYTFRGFMTYSMQ